MDNTQNLPQEIWKPVVGWEGLYEVSNLGRVRSLRHLVIGSDGRQRWFPETIRKIVVCYGYCYVLLCKNQQSKRYLVHRLVAEAFIPNPCNKRCVDHISTNRLDNRAENLRWVTHKENQNNPITAKRLRSHGRPVVRISPDGEKKVYPMVKSVRQDGFTDTSVCACCKELIENYAGYKWVYLDSYDDPSLDKYREDLISIPILIRPIIAIKGEEVIEFDSVKSASKKGFERLAIHRCLSNPERKYKGYQWRYKDVG